jgi:iron-sulfur cluster repair protein YtfE (RIC family)
MHFYKEEQILYPMAQQFLAPGVLEEVGAAIAAMDEAEAAARRCLDADR